MTRSEFLKTLAARLDGLPKSEIDKSVTYYNEMISDRMEDGMEEEAAVAASGNLDEIVENIKLDAPISSLMKARIADTKNNSNNTVLWIIILILGFPIWFPIMITVVSLLFALYVVIWSLAIALFAVLFSFAISAIAMIGTGIAMCFTDPPAGMFLLGGGLILASLMLLLTKPISFLAKGLFSCTGKLARSVKSLFIKKGGEAK